MPHSSRCLRRVREATAPPCSRLRLTLNAQPELLTPNSKCPPPHSRPRRELVHLSIALSLNSSASCSSSSSRISRKNFAGSPSRSLRRTRPGWASSVWRRHSGTSGAEARARGASYAGAGSPGLLRALSAGAGRACVATLGIIFRRAGFQPYRTRFAGSASPFRRFIRSMNLSLVLESWREKECRAGRTRRYV